MFVHIYSHRWTPRESFFSKIPNFWVRQTNWAEKCRGIFCIFGQTIVPIFALFMVLSIWLGFFLQKKPLDFWPNMILAIKNLEDSHHTNHANTVRPSVCCIFECFYWKFYFLTYSNLYPNTSDASGSTAENESSLLFLAIRKGLFKLVPVPMDIRCV